MGLEFPGAGMTWALNRTIIVDFLCKRAIQSKRKKKEKN